MTQQQDFYAHLRQELQGIRDAGLFKGERVIPRHRAHTYAPWRRTARRTTGSTCAANNYLGLSSHPDVVTVAHEALRTHGYGLMS